MSEKINGEQASQLFIQGKAIQHQNLCDEWLDVGDDVKISYFRMRKDEMAFREKPPFIVINDVEVPAPILNLTTGRAYFILNGSKQGGYDRVLYENDKFIASMGCWESESDIIKVINAFAKSFKKLIDQGAKS